MIEMDSRRPPPDKLACLLDACKHTLEALKLSKRSSAAAAAAAAAAEAPPSPTRVTINADDFLPAFIYVLLKANPPLLHSNLLFIQNFAAPERLAIGECAYYFTNLVRCHRHTRSYSHLLCTHTRLLSYICCVRCAVRLRLVHRDFARRAARPLTGRGIYIYNVTIMAQFMVQ